MLIYLRLGEWGVLFLILQGTTLYIPTIIFDLLEDAELRSLI